MNVAAPETSLPLGSPAEPWAVSLGGRGFAHLHVHTEFSKQDGLGRLKDLVKKIASDVDAEGNLLQPAVAMTDHGNMGGAWKFVKECLKAGITPVLGIEAYLAVLAPGMDWDSPYARFARTSVLSIDAEEGKEKTLSNHHLTILAENQTGWRNLCAMTNAAEESFYAKPLIDYALLHKAGHSRWDEETKTLIETPDPVGGLIVLTGCLGGPVASRVARGDLDGAREHLEILIECVGRDNVYVEIMEHGLSAEGPGHMKALATLADEAGVKVVATNDCHYVHAHDGEGDGTHAGRRNSAHSMWLASGSKNTINSPNRWVFNGSGYHVRTAAEMREIYSGWRWQSACDATLEIADRVRAGLPSDDQGKPTASVIPTKALRLPTFPVPPGTVNPDPDRFKTLSDAYLYSQVMAGAKRRFGADVFTRGDEFSATVKERLRMEFDIIRGFGISDYFLIVADVIDWCRSDRGLPSAEHPQGKPGEKKPILVGPGRGSAAGSLVSYSVGIVQVDPLRNDLLFERFLSPDRVGMPDIDVDFESARRNEVYDYLVAKYGAEYIARIGAFQIAKTKRAIKDAARVLELSDVGNKVAGLVPVKQGAPQTFAQLFEEIRDADGKPVENPEGKPFRDLVAADADAARIVTLARAFENVAAGEGIHAAGVIIADEPLTTLLPMRREREKKTNRPVGVAIAWWDGKDADDFGLLKLDALSLRNLDVVAAAVEHVEAVRGTIVDPDDLPDPDSGTPDVKAAFALFKEGRTQGLFQMESKGMTDLATQVEPDRFGDLSALVALYRPGPMGEDMHVMYGDRKNARTEVDYGIYTSDPAEQQIIAGVLGDTYGLVAYQEQMMALAGVMAGFDAVQRSNLRKGIGKKDKAVIAALRSSFFEQGTTELTLADGTTKPAFAATTLARVWSVFEAAAAYAFNKSHSAAYGYLAYVTAYMKATYPTEYAAALLGTTDKADKRLPVLVSLRREGVEVTQPDINHSGVNTAPHPDQKSTVILGLSEIRDVGNNATHIVAARERLGRPFTSLADLYENVTVPTGDEGVSRLSSTVIEALIESGAFDCFGPRLGHLLVFRALADGTALPIPPAEWSLLEKVNRQRHRLGVALGDSPLTRLKAERADLTLVDDALARASAAANADDGGEDPYYAGPQSSRMSVTGLLTDISERITRKGQKMGRFTLSGVEGSVDGLVWPRTYEGWLKAGTVPAVGDVVTFTGEFKTSTRTIETTENVEDENGEIVSQTVERTIETTEFAADSCIVINVEQEPVYPRPVLVPSLPALPAVYEATRQDDIAIAS